MNGGDQQMRSCLIQILLALAVVFCLVWFALPIGVAAMVQAALNASGFTGTDTQVSVSSDPPFMLLTGHADRIHITSTQAGIDPLHAESVDIVLGDVDLLSRDIGTVNGTLLGVKVAAPNGDPVAIYRVTLAGAATSSRATASISVAEAQTLAEQQLKAQGISAKVALKAPDVVTLTVAGKSQAGRLMAINGALVLVPNSNSLPSVTLISPGPGNPFHVTSVTITVDGMTLMGLLDVQKLLG
jgi:hypothetical protein